MITRSCGIYVQGYRPGGGYEGKTKELDAIVSQAAGIMEKTFGCEITIRFNSDRESGGAFIKDKNWSASVGICARLSNSVFEKMDSSEKVSALLNLSSLDFDKMFPSDSIVINTLIDKSLLNEVCSGVQRESESCVHETLQDAINYIIENVNKKAFDEFMKDIYL